MSKDNKKLAKWQRLLDKMVKEGKLGKKGTPEDRAKHQQEVNNSLKEARTRANEHRLRE